MPKTASQQEVMSCKPYKQCYTTTYDIVALLGKITKFVQLPKKKKQGVLDYQDDQVQKQFFDNQGIKSLYFVGFFWKSTLNIRSRNIFSNFAIVCVMYLVVVVAYIHNLYHRRDQYCGQY